MRQLALATTLVAFPTLAFAGEPLPAVFVTDSSNDNVWRLEDLNGDGDYNDAGEVAEYYSDTLGPFSLSNNNVLEQSPDGTLYVGDTSSDVILSLRDSDLDGECNDVGETLLFFDGDPSMNAAGIDMSAVTDLTWGPDGRLWGSNANNGGGGFDGIFWMEDLNDDGDANDANEAGIYYDNVQPVVGDTAPNALVFGPDGEVYYVEAGLTGAFAKGVYRLEDSDLSGTIDQPGEAAAFFIPASQPSAPFFWDIEFGADGAFYMADSGNNLIWRFEDTSGNDLVEVGSEDTLWWQGTSSLIWQLQTGRGAAILAAETQAPDRVLRFSDDDSSGTIDAGEQTAVYDDTISSVVIGNPRGMTVDLSSGYGPTFCNGGDGSLAFCPCSPGDLDTGCDSAIPPMQGGGLSGGISLSVVAQEKNAQNRATLITGGLPTGSATPAVGLRNSYLETTPAVFGDGIRCVGGLGATRIGATVGVGGSSVHTFGHGSMAGAGTFYYQVWFRSVPISFCDPTAAFGLSSGQALTW